MTTFTIPEDMDVPKQRRQLSDKNVAWLLRNLAVRNSQHPQFQETIETLKDIQRIVNIGKQFIPEEYK